MKVPAVSLFMYSANFDYVRMIINPQTPEELRLALRDPHSPAYKRMMYMLIEQLQIEIIIEKLIETHLFITKQVDQIEKRDMYERMQKSKTDHTKLLNEKSECKLESHRGKSSFELEIANRHLATEIKVIEYDIKQIKKHQHKTYKKWEISHQTRLKETVSKLFLVKENGEITPLDPETQNIIRKKIIHSPSLIKVIEKVVDASEKNNDKIFDPKYIPKQKSLLDELTTLIEMKNALKENFSPSFVARQHKLAANKSAFKHLNSTATENEMIAKLISLHQQERRAKKKLAEKKELKESLEQKPQASVAYFEPLTNVTRNKI